MSMYAVKNDAGEFAFCEIGKQHWETGFGTIWTELNKPYAQRTADDIGGHVVELVEKPTPVVVSEDMASWLSDAKEMRMPIEFLARCKVPDSDQEDMLRAYVNGWTVEKPKRYVLPMPDGNPGETTENILLAVKDDIGWHQSEHRYSLSLGLYPEGSTVTKADIDAAPAWVRALTPVEEKD